MKKFLFRSKGIPMEVEEEELSNNALLHALLTPFQEFWIPFDMRKNQSFSLCTKNCIIFFFPFSFFLFPFFFCSFLFFFSHSKFEIEVVCSLNREEIVGKVFLISWSAANKTLMQLKKKFSNHFNWSWCLILSTHEAWRLEFHKKCRKICW